MSLRPPDLTPLFKLPVAGAGGGFVESLASHFMRLAEQHVNTVGQLIEYLNEQSPTTIPMSLRRPNSYMISDATPYVNSASPLARWLVSNLEKQTGHTDLAPLTWLPWGQTVSGFRLMRGGRAWCAACLQLQADLEIDVHEPLVWSLQLYRSCPYHGPLSEECPTCKRISTPMLGPFARVGHCAACGGWLGVRGLRPRWTRALEAELAQLVARSQHLPVRPSDEILMTVVSDHFGGHYTAMARELGVPKATFNSWLRAGVRPSLDWWVQLAQSLGCSLSELLLRPAEMRRVGGSGPATRPNRLAPGAVGRLRDAFTALLAEVPPPPLGSVAKALGVHQKSLQYAFPAEYAIASERRARYARDRSEAKIRAAMADAEAATYRAHILGALPTKRTVENLMQKPGYMINRRVRDAHKAELVRLGYPVPAFEAESAR